MLSGKRRHDFEVSFIKAVNCLTRERGTTQEYRDAAVNELIGGYCAEVGEYPSDDLLAKLADILLSDIFNDPNPYKHRELEYSILSDDQLMRKRTGIRSAKQFRKIEVPIVDDEVDYYNNETLRKYNVYNPPVKYASIKHEIIDEARKYEALNKTQPVTISYIEPQPKEYKVAISISGRGEDNRLWAQAIKNRDKYTCQNPNCNSRVGIMHAHHIDSYVDNEDLRLELSNGITLCESCHTSFHSTFGKGGNNYGQLADFFNK